VNNQGFGWRDLNTLERNIMVSATAIDTGPIALDAEAVQLVETLKRDGFVMFTKFFDLAQVERAFQEINSLFEMDLMDRKSCGTTKEHYDSSAGHTVLTRPTHLLIDFYGKSPTFDAMFEKILSDPLSRSVLRQLAGEDIKLRGYNCTRLTGEYDPAPNIGPASNPHDWHRDSPGEFGFGIYLSDFAAPNQGTTSLIRGSHKFPFCPRWNCLFGVPYHNGSELFLKLNPFNRLLARRILREATGAYGQRGDFYIFLNDTWHGREPNLNGHKGMRVMVGAFPGDVPYPDNVKPVHGDVLQKLPPNLRAVAPHKDALVSKPMPKPVLENIWRAQKENTTVASLFTLARIERRCADKLSAAGKSMKRGMSAIYSTVAGVFPKRTT
jgi:hypothetical protein